MSQLPLEDKFGDVVRKAMRGKKIQPADLARQTGLTDQQLGDLFEYKYTPSDDVIRKLAPLCSLNPNALIDHAHSRWKPRDINTAQLGCLAQISAQYEDYIVNTFLVWDKTTKQAVLFDTGPDLAAIEKAVRDNSLKIELLLLTHTHPDHVAVLGDVLKKFKPKAFTSPREPADGCAPVKEGDKHRVGALAIEIRETDGHSVGGLTFVVTGQGGVPPIAVVGDAIFASSMGGPMISYENLTSHIRKKILTLPPETILCPGHGPLTTVGEEKAHNPFFA